MIKGRKGALLLFVAVCLWLAKVQAQPAEMDALLQPYVKTNNFSGSVLLAHNGKVVFSKSYGRMHRSYDLPNTANTKFYLASVSMVFTSAAVMKLVEEGMVSLTDPLSKYWPEYKWGKGITVHHLLSQRSGIANIGLLKNRNYDSLSKFAHSIPQLMAHFADDSLVFETGSRYSHARSDYILLAYIIEKVTGKPFGVYLKETIFDPLGMSNTGHASSDKTIVQNLAAGYSPVGHYDLQNADQINWSSKTGHGSIYATAEDLHRFAEAVLQNKLLSKASWQKIFTDYGDAVGYGWFIRDHLDKKRVQMNGRSPGFSSYISIYPNDNLLVIVLSNIEAPLPPELGKELAAVHFKKPYSKPRLSLAALRPEDAQRLVGRYRFDEKFYRPNFEMTLTYKDGKLSADWGELLPVDEGGKRVKKFILRNYWSDVQFVENGEGQVEAMTYDGFKGLKIK